MGKSVNEPDYAFGSDKEPVVLTSLEYVKAEAVAKQVEEDFR
jgi:hypothetical protein